MTFEPQAALDAILTGRAPEGLDVTGTLDLAGLVRMVITERQLSDPVERAKAHTNLLPPVLLTRTGNGTRRLAASGSSSLDRNNKTARAE